MSRGQQYFRYCMERRWLLDLHLDAVGSAELGDSEAALNAVSSGILLGVGATDHLNVVVDFKTFTIEPKAMSGRHISDMTKPSCEALSREFSNYEEVSSLVAICLWSLVLKLRAKLGVESYE